MALTPIVVAAAEPAPVAIRVGSVEYTVPVLQVMLQELQPAQARALPSLRAFAEQVISDQLLRQHIAQSESQPGFRQARDAALAHGLERKLLASVVVKEDEVNQYYQRNLDRYQRGAAIQIWRIVLRSHDEATQLLAELRQSTAPAVLWGQLARQHSLDDATRMRGGSLGFVRADGHTDVPQLRVAPAVFEAVSKLRDGELASEPLASGDHFALLWRRGTKPARIVPVASARPEIISLLTRKKTAESLEALLVKLRQSHLASYAPEALQAIEYALPTTPARRDRIPAHPPEASPKPKATPQGDR